MIRPIIYPLLFVAGALIVLAGTLRAQKIGVTATGTASYYADKFHGRPTASGELFNKNAMTAAHKKYKFGTMLKVTNLRNQKSVVVRVNDRGPYVHGRIVDVSLAAAAEMDMLGTGTAPVRIEVVGLNGQILPPPPKPATESTAEAKRGDGPDLVRRNEVSPRKSTPSEPEPQEGENASSNPAAPKPPAPAPDAPEPFATEGTYTLQGKRRQITPGNPFTIQAGAFSKLKNAKMLLRKIRAKGYSKVWIQVVPTATGNFLYKVVIGEYESKSVAAKNLTELKQKGISAILSRHNDLAN